MFYFDSEYRSNIEASSLEEAKNRAYYKNEVFQDCEWNDATHAIPIERVMVSGSTRCIRARVIGNDLVSNCSDFGERIVGTVESEIFKPIRTISF